MKDWEYIVALSLVGVLLYVEFEKLSAVQASTASAATTALQSSIDADIGPVASEVSASLAAPLNVTQQSPGLFGTAGFL